MNRVVSLVDGERMNRRNETLQRPERQSGIRRRTSTTCSTLPHCEATVGDLQP
jgi:hypothetical protein